jgi:hypothetical protein
VVILRNGDNYFMISDLIEAAGRLAVGGCAFAFPEASTNKFSFAL